MNDVFRRGSAALAALCALLVLACAASADEVTKTVDIRTSDGQKLHTIVKGESPLTARPTIVEISPYAPDEQSATFGRAYNRLIVHARGTGMSTGQWDGIGLRDQEDVAEALAWACEQPWSNGHLGLLGFSASAMAVYNSLRLPLACVDAAALGAGSNELYRDLLYPGGIPNFTTAFGVGLLVLAPTAIAKLQQQAPADLATATAGLLTMAKNWFTRPTEDDWWNGHNVEPGPNTFPILAATGFYDVESRGAFENFRALKNSHPGTHLAVIGGHDGHPSTLPHPFVQYGRWFDHYLRGIDNGIDREPAVQLLLSNGSHGAMLNGDVTRVEAADWPVPGTKWQRLYLNPTRAGGGNSINDGSFSAAAPTGPWWMPDLPSTQAYPGITSLAPASDVNTTSMTGDIETTPPIAQMNGAGPASLTYTTPPLRSAVDAAGPAALDIWLASTANEADIHAVLTDVWPDGRAFPVAQGRLRTSFPYIDRARSITDSRGEIVEPYPLFDAKRYTPSLTSREYHVEFWPVGNHFAAGHRLRLYLTGTSPLMLAPAPGINFVSAGRTMPTRLLLPVLPGSDMCSAAALGPNCS